jgi:uncharacterized protein
MKRIQQEFRVTIRVHFDRTNLPHADDLFESEKAALGDDPRFPMRFRKVGKWGGPNDDALDVYGVKEATQQLVQLTTKAERMGLPTDDLAETLLPAPGTVCYAARPYSLTH